MAKLIAYYSRAGENYFGGALKQIKEGNTAKVAKMLAKMTGADLFEIQQKVPYSDDYKECVAEAREDFQKNASTMPMAVYAFLEHYDFAGKTIHPFCTHEGSGLVHTEQEIANTAKGAVVKKGLAIHGSSVDTAEEALKAWIEK